MKITLKLFAAMLTFLAAMLPAGTSAQESIDVMTADGTYTRVYKGKESVETDNHVCRWTSASTSPQIVVATESNVNNIKVPEGLWYSLAGQGMNYTISISDDARLLGYEIIFTAYDPGSPIVMTPSEGGEAVTAVDYDEAALSVYGLSTQQTTFNISSPGGVKAAKVSSFVIYYEKKQEVTFHVLNADDEEVASASAYFFDGDPLVIPSELTTVPFCTFDWDERKPFIDGITDVDVHFLYNGPVRLGTPSNPCWQFLCVGDSVGEAKTWAPFSYLDASRFTDGRFDLGECGSYGSSTGLGNPQNMTDHGGLWSFQGDPWNGIRIASALGGVLTSSTAMSSDDEGGSTCPYLAGEGSGDGAQLWEILTASENIDNGFYLRLRGTNHCLNERQDGSRFYLAYWTGGTGVGSTFRALESLPEIESYEIGSWHYATSCLPFTTTVPDDGSVKAYTATLSADKKTLLMKEIADGIIPAHEGVVLRSTTKPVLTIAAEEADGLAQENILVGTLENIEVTAADRSDYLVLGWSGSVGFYVSNTISRIAAHTAYIDNAKLKLTRGCKLNFDMADGIDDVLLNCNGSQHRHVRGTFDLTGRRVSSRTQRGVYIENGRKVMF